MATKSSKNEQEKMEGEGRLVGSGRFDLLNEPGARVVRQAERKATRRLKASGASPGAADWGGASDAKSPLRKGSR